MHCLIPNSKLVGNLKFFGGSRPRSAFHRDFDYFRREKWWAHSQWFLQLAWFRISKKRITISVRKTSKSLPLVNALEVKILGNLGSLSENTAFVGFAGV